MSRLALFSKVGSCYKVWYMKQSMVSEGLWGTLSDA